MRPSVGNGVEVVALPGRPVDGWFEPDSLLAALAARGLGRVLVEGGGRTVSAFLAAGVLDRLYLTTAPRLIGDGVPGVRFAGADRLAEALTAPVHRFALGDDLCTVFDFAAGRDDGSAAGHAGATGADGSAGREREHIPVPDPDPKPA